MPAVLWCPSGWQSVCAAALIRCETTCSANGPGNDSCPMARNEAPGSAREECDAATGCRLAQAARDDCGASSARPMAHATPAPTPHRAACPRGHDFCFGDPAGGNGVPTSAPQVHAAPDVVAIVSIVETNFRAIAVASLTPPVQSRPPPRTWSRRPPARAPPSCELT